MNTIVYLLQVSASLGFFFALYYFLLRKFTFFTINRWYLLATLAFSFIIPLLTFTVRNEFVQGAVYVNQFQHLPAQLEGVNGKKAVLQAPINWFGVLTVAYLIIAIGLFAKMIVTLFVLFGKTTLKSSTKIGQVHIIRGNNRVGNGSFLNYIFLKEEKLEGDEVQQIIEHEMLHVKLLHSVDRILLEFSKIILWFNPLIYLCARAVEENHEFEVDYEIGRKADKSRYADLLLKLSTANRSTLYHTFSKIPLEKRITMLFKQPTKSMKKMIYVLVLPIGVLSCLAFANLKTEKKSVDSRKTNAQAGLYYKLSAGFGLQTSPSPFYSRLHINKNGKTFDKVTFNLADGSGSANLGTDDLLGVFIDGVFYKEDEVKKLPVEKTASLTFDKSKGAMKLDKIPEGNYAIPFCFKTINK